MEVAKAFDNVNHHILVKRISNHKMKGKLAKWLENFLYNRKYCVVANGAMSDNYNVISGVPQGTVLASLYFIIMIADIDNNLKISISRLFADNKKVSAKRKRRHGTAATGP